MRFFGCEASSLAITPTATGFPVRGMLHLVFFLLGDSRRLNFLCRRVETLCLYHLRLNKKRPMKMEDQNIPKRRHRKCRRRGIPQKK